MRVQQHLQALSLAVADLLAASAAAGSSRDAWVDIATAAQHAACSPDTVRDWIRRGDLPVGRVGARSLRVRLSDVDVLLTRAGAETVRTQPAEDREIANRVLRSLVRK